MRGWKFSHSPSNLRRHLIQEGVERLGFISTQTTHQSPSKLPPIKHQKFLLTPWNFGPQIYSSHFPFSFLFISSPLHLHHTFKLQPISWTSGLNLTSSTPRKGRISILFLSLMDGSYMGFHLSSFLWCYIGCRWWFLVGLIWVFGLELKLEGEN